MKKWHIFLVFFHFWLIFTLVSFEYFLAFQSTTLQFMYLIDYFSYIVALCLWLFPCEQCTKSFPYKKCWKKHGKTNAFSMLLLHSVIFNKKLFEEAWKNQHILLVTSALSHFQQETFFCLKKEAWKNQYAFLVTSELSHFLDIVALCLSLPLNFFLLRWKDLLEYPIQNEGKNEVTENQNQDSDKEDRYKRLDRLIDWLRTCPLFSPN